MKGELGCAGEKKIRRPYSYLTKLYVIHTKIPTQCVKWARYMGSVCPRQVIFSVVQQITFEGYLSYGHPNKSLSASLEAGPWHSTPCVLSSFDLTQRLSNYTRVSANFMSHAWQEAGSWARVASNTPRWHYCFFFSFDCRYFWWFDRCKKRHSALWRESGSGF